MPALTIYFDGSCPLCRREIAFYKGNPDAAQLVWHDVSVNFQANDDSSLGDGLSCQRAMAFFHVRDAHGNLKDQNRLVGPVRGVVTMAEKNTDIPTHAHRADHELNALSAWFLSKQK